MMLAMPEKLNFANTPTPVYKMNYLSKKLGINFYVKRDDYTGNEFSGNKIRKLEFCLAEAQKNNCDTIITCGGIQSNHCRATAAICAREGLKSVLLLRKNDHCEIDGNLFLDKLLGADVRFVTREEYSAKRFEIMNNIKDEYKEKGHNAYVIPEGGSFGIGNFGYVKCMEEIIAWQNETEIKLDTLCATAGSGGTVAGLILGNRLLNAGLRVCGVCICDDKDYFVNKIDTILKESNSYLTENQNFSLDEIEIIEGYQGAGYSIAADEDIEFIKEIAKNEGMVLDHVYNAKALRGFVTELQKGTFDNVQNVMYINTGGVFGLLSNTKQFNF